MDHLHLGKKAWERMGKYGNGSGKLYGVDDQQRKSHSDIVVEKVLLTLKTMGISKLLHKNVHDFFLLAISTKFLYENFQWSA